MFSLITVVLFLIGKVKFKWTYGKEGIKKAI